jgi:hypothetical protein
MRMTPAPKDTRSSAKREPKIIRFTEALARARKLRIDGDHEVVSVCWDAENGCYTLHTGYGARNVVEVVR